MYFTLNNKGCFIHFPTSNEFLVFLVLLFYFVNNKSEFPDKTQNSVVENNKGKSPSHIIKTWSAVQVCLLRVCVVGWGMRWTDDQPTG